MSIQTSPGVYQVTNLNPPQKEFRPPIRHRRCPKWLLKISTKDRFPLRQFLRDSVYYPCCGFDGTPVRFLNLYCSCYLYVDAMIPREEVVSSLRSSKHRFKGYRILGMRDLDEREFPRMDPQDIPLPLTDDERWGIEEKRCRWWCEPFALWVLLERESGCGPEFGPERLCLVMAAADAVAQFHSLYRRYHFAPRGICLIQALMSWTDMHDPEGTFARTVLENSVGPPPVIIYGGYGKGYHKIPCCWTPYTKHISSWRVGWNLYTLWRHQSFSYHLHRNTH